MPMTKPCEHCGEVFSFKPSRLGRARFCSMPCRSTFTARATAERRGDMMRGRGAGKAYRKRDGRHEHRAVVERRIGRPLRPDEVVHHIDHDHLNNDPSNLVVMTRAEHMREHGIGIPGAPLTWRPWEKRRSR